MLCILHLRVLLKPYVCVYLYFVWSIHIDRCQPPRMLPCVLPHLLVQSLFEHKMWPTQLMPELHGAKSEYWDHMDAHTSWGPQHPGRHTHEPVALYGDDAAVNKNGEKLFCVTLSHVLDPRKNSMCTLWPLCVFKGATRLHWMFQYVFYAKSWEGCACGFVCPTVSGWLFSC